MADDWQAKITGCSHSDTCAGPANTRGGFFAPLLALLTACAALPSPQERHQQANALAAAHQWHETTLVTPPFCLKSYGPPPIRQQRF